VVVEGTSKEIVFSGLEDILSEDNVQIRIFGKPEIKGHRRLGVILATDDSVEGALDKVERAYSKLKVEVL
jgi:phosphoribosylglycinamide formyltransferase 2